MLGNHRPKRQRAAPQSWTSSILTQRRSVLLLDMTYTEVETHLYYKCNRVPLSELENPIKCPQQGVELAQKGFLVPRDLGLELAQLVQIEMPNVDHVYTVSPTKYPEIITDPNRHYSFQFCDANFVALFRTQCANVKFRQIVLSNAHQTLQKELQKQNSSFFTQVLPDFVTNRLLDIESGSASVFLPFDFQIVTQIMKYFDILSRHYVITLIDEQSSIKENVLVQASSQLDQELIKAEFNVDLDSEWIAKASKCSKQILESQSLLSHEIFTRENTDLSQIRAVKLKAIPPKVVTKPIKVKVQKEKLKPLEVQRKTKPVVHYVKEDEKQFGGDELISLIIMYAKLDKGNKWSKMSELMFHKHGVRRSPELLKSQWETWILSGDPPSSNLNINDNDKLLEKFDKFEAPSLSIRLTQQLAPYETICGSAKRGLRCKACLHPFHFNNPFEFLNRFHSDVCEHICSCEHIPDYVKINVAFAKCSLKGDSKNGRDPNLFLAKLWCRFNPVVYRKNIEEDFLDLDSHFNEAPISASSESSDDKNVDRPRRSKRVRVMTSWQSSIPDRRRSVLFLGMTYINVELLLFYKYPSVQMNHSLKSVEQAAELVQLGLVSSELGRDLARCIAVEAPDTDQTYTVSLHEHEHFDLRRHGKLDFNDIDFVTKYQTLFPNIKFRQIVMDYVWEPTVDQAFFKIILPDIVNKRLLDVEGTPEGATVYLPFSLKCLSYVLENLSSLSKCYEISFLRDSELRDNCLWSATKTIDRDLMSDVFLMNIDKDFAEVCSSCVNGSSCDKNLGRNDIYIKLLAKWGPDLNNICMIRLTAVLNCHEGGIHELENDFDPTLMEIDSSAINKVVANGPCQFLDSFTPVKGKSKIISPETSGCSEDATKMKQSKIQKVAQTTKTWSKAGNKKTRRRFFDVERWQKSIPVDHSNVLCLGVSYASAEQAQAKFPKVQLNSNPKTVDAGIEMVTKCVLTQMDGRDLTRCYALEESGPFSAYCVSLEKAAKYDSSRHMTANFNRENFVRDLQMNFPMVKFKQIILDYYWIPRGTWAMTHWVRSFFKTTLPNFVREKVLDLDDSSSAVFLPFCLHCVQQVLSCIEELKPWYEVSFIKKDDLYQHFLWSATNTIDASAMQGILGKAIDQEEIYCTFDMIECRSVIDDEFVRKEDIMDLLERIDSFDDVRMIKLQPIGTGGKGGFKGLLRRKKKVPPKRKVAKSIKASGTMSTSYEVPEKYSQLIFPNQVIFCQILLGLLSKEHFNNMMSWSKDGLSWQVVDWRKLQSFFQIDALGFQYVCKKMGFRRKGIQNDDKTDYIFSREYFTRNNCRIKSKNDDAGTMIEPFNFSIDDKMLHKGIKQGNKSIMRIPVAVNDILEVFWSDDQKYYRGKVECVEEGGSRARIRYEDSQIETVDLAVEEYRVVESEPNRVNSSAESPIQEMDEFLVNYSNQSFKDLDHKIADISETQPPVTVEKGGSQGASNENQETKRTAGGTEIVLDSHYVKPNSNDVVLSRIENMVNSSSALFLNLLWENFQAVPLLGISVYSDKGLRLLTLLIDNSVKKLSSRFSGRYLVQTGNQFAMIGTDDVFTWLKNQTISGELWKFVAIMQTREI